MRYISKEILIDLLLLIEEKASLVISRNESILSVQDFLVSPERMEKFDAACMLIQVIGETAKKIDEKTSSQLFSNYPQVYWRGVFGCRNIISHEYGNVDPEQIFGIIKKYLPELIACVRQIIDDVKQGNFDYLFT
ncbi:HepT-like ribonuclease domain-containing protein [uncultured Bacteroides sp.]|uniref:HepT-like ribonuclease domain-containing protein n=1 Tax=uncultured Bacteroides sp. TaxID=162156 RepID=UPI00259AAE69|nr:HepT-like ribonuclease domain-containing protein [uncultured Bacteroides sp.]